MKIEIIDGLKLENFIVGQTFDKNVSKIRVKFPFKKIKDDEGKDMKGNWGVFINDFPLPIHPTLDKNNYWELDTEGDCLISSVKFVYIYKENEFYVNDEAGFLIEAFYED